MDKLAVLQTLVVGVGLATLFYWIGILLGRIGTNPHEFKWWIKTIIPQGIVLAFALKVFKIF